MVALWIAVVRSEKAGDQARVLRLGTFLQEVFRLFPWDEPLGSSVVVAAADIAFAVPWRESLAVTIVPR